MRSGTVVEQVPLIWKRFVSSLCKPTLGTCELIKMSEKSLPNDNCPLPVVLSRGRGSFLYDVSGKEYLDFLSGYAAVSLGHSHPKMYKALCEQGKKLTHVSRSFYTKVLAEYADYITNLFCYDKVLPLNSGTEACESAVKIARKWGYRCKGICPNNALVIVAENNVWGRSIAAMSSSNKDKNSKDFGPLLNGFTQVPFNDIDCLAYKLRDPCVCAFMVEPVQGEAGVIIPDPCYLKHVRDLCTFYNVLMIVDEVQTGLGRTGAMLCCDIYKVKPDILILGKALGGGVIPVSAVLADCSIMDVIEPGTHGSTFGGNALGCHMALTALKIIQEEKLCKNARYMGEVLRTCLCDLPKDVVCEVRGLGLLNAIVLREGIDSHDLCINLMCNGLLTGKALGNAIRLCPPLTIKEKEIVKASKIIRHCLESSRGSCGGAKGPTNQNAYRKK